MVGITAGDLDRSLAMGGELPRLNPAEIVIEDDDRSGIELTTLGGVEEAGQLVVEARGIATGARVGRLGGIGRLRLPSEKQRQRGKHQPPSVVS